MVPYKNSYLAQVVERAIRRIKPCSQKGEEFRDVLLWLTVLDIARADTQKMVVFISSNVKEFASADGSLDLALLKEAEREGLTIKYYNSIANFAKDHATKIDYITSEWLTSVISTATINMRMLDKLRKYGLDRLVKWVERVGKVTTGYVNPISSRLALDEFYVYEMTDGSLHVEAMYRGNIEVEFELEEAMEESSLDYEYEYDEDEDEFDFRPVLHRYAKIKAVTKYLYPEVQATIGITIKDKEVKDFEIIDWDLV